MSKKIGLYFRMPDRNVGCKKVVENTLKGMREIGVEVVENTPMPMTGCIHGGLPEFKARTLPKNTLIGPEIMVLPTEMPWAFQTWKNWTQPSRWAIDYMIQGYPQIVGNNQFSVWATGIDTTMFNSDGRGDFEYDCFFYFKNVTKQCSPVDLEPIKRFMDSKGMKHTTITYGSYDEREMIRLAKKSKFAVFLTGTESQGIAYMEVLSMNCPILMFECNNFKYGNFSFSNANVSSAPYFDSRCGKKINSFNPDMFMTFKEQVEKGQYSPREYIMENHTLAKGAQQYMNILDQIA